MRHKSWLVSFVAFGRIHCTWQRVRHCCTTRDVLMDVMYLVATPVMCAKSLTAYRCEAARAWKQL